MNVKLIAAWLLSGVGGGAAAIVGDARGFSFFMAGVVVSLCVGVLLRAS